MTKINLYLNCGSDYSIQDDAGVKYTPEQAKQLVDNGNVADCSLAFRRLMLNDYSIEAVKAFYKEHP